MNVSTNYANVDAGFYVRGRGTHLVDEES